MAACIIIDTAIHAFIIVPGGLMKVLLYIIFFAFIPHVMDAQMWQRDSAYLNLRVNDDTTTQIQNEQQIVMHPHDTTNMVAVWRDFRVGYRQVAYGYTFDGGLTWNQDLFVEPQYIWDSDPGITVDTAGNFFAVILSFNSTYEPNGLFVYRSTDGGQTWAGPFTVINGVAGVFEDKELIACDRSGGPYTDNLYVTWARFYTTRILLSRSVDGGTTFTDPVIVSDNTGVQWPVPVIGPQSEVYVAWVHYSPGSIRLDRSTDGGQTFGSDIVVQNVTFVQGNLNGNLTTFSFPAMDADITQGPYHGNLYIAFTDDAPGYSDTDIYFTRSTNSGTSWSSRIRLNDDPLNNGCDQFHPWLVVAPDGSIIVVWLDRRLDPNNLYMDLYMTCSTDGGITWAQNERISTVSSDPTAGSFSMIPPEPLSKDQPIICAGRAGLIGEYIGLTASSIEDIHPVWTDTRLGDQDAFFAVKDSTVQSVRDISTYQHHPDLMIVPNPAYGQCEFIIPPELCNEYTTCTIYDVRGRAVYTFPYVTPILCWYGATDNNQNVPSGIYFFCLSSTKSSITRKCIFH